MVALVLATAAACGTDVPAGLAAKVESGCPGLLKPEPLAVITEGFVVSQVVSEVADSCKVSVSDGREVLSLGLVAYASQEESERLTPMLCTSGALDPGTKSCKASEPSGGGLSVHAVAGRWNVRVSVRGIPVNGDGEKAVQQIIENLRNSDRTKCGGAGSFESAVLPARGSRGTKPPRSPAASTSDTCVRS